MLFAPESKAEQVNKKVFTEVPTDRKPAPVMGAETIRAGLKSHDKALYIKSGWIRDPYISIGPEKKYYYLTGTQPNEGDPREAENPYNIGLGDESIVGHQVRLWRSSRFNSVGFNGPNLYSRRHDEGEERQENPEASDLGTGSTLVGRQRLLGIGALPQEALQSGTDQRCGVARPLDAPDGWQHGAAARPFDFH